MKTVIYLDVLLLVNFLIAWLLLAAAGALTGQGAPFGRMLAASGMAAASSLVILVPELNGPVSMLYRLASCAAIAAAAYGWKPLRRWLAAAFWFAALNLLLAGVCMLWIGQGGGGLVQTANLAVYLNLPPWLLLLLCGGCCAAVELALRLLGNVKAPVETVGLEFNLCGACVRVRAALDTGCHLKDPISCQPVLLVSYPDAQARLPAELQAYLGGWFEGSRTLTPPEGERLRMIPCSTATGKTVLPGFAVGGIGLIRPDGAFELGRPVVAFACQSFGEGRYEAVYGSEFL